MSEEGFTFGDVEELSGETKVALQEEERELTEKEKEIARLKAAEKFMMRDTGDATCRTCGYTYKMEMGDRLMPRNTPFELVPDSWVCPNCNSPKAFFDQYRSRSPALQTTRSMGLEQTRGRNPKSRPPSSAALLLSSSSSWGATGSIESCVYVLASGTTGSLSPAEGAALLAYWACMIASCTIHVSHFLFSAHTFTRCIH